MESSGIKFFLHFLYQVAGQGPSIGEVRERVNERETNSAHQSGSDFVRFGAIPRSQPSLQLAQTEGVCKPPTKVVQPRNMFKKRLNDALKRKMRVREINTKSTRVYRVANSERGVKTFAVKITNTPSCDCLDFRKNKSKVLCQHIIFVVVVLLEEPSLTETLRTRYLGSDDVNRLNAKTLVAEFMQQKKKRTW